MPTLLDRVRAALAPDFIVERELGLGGMGAVFLARDQRLAREVAVKVLRPEMGTAVAVERFTREARVLARLNHPNIVPVHRAGESDGLHWFVMELSTGETLSSRLERGTIEPRHAAAIARDVLAGLGAAHAAGVIHRDVKPSNVFLEARGARLGDFGIAHDELVESLTRTGSYIGTAPWMAPEQRAGEPASTRTDLWAAGAVLYEMLTGRRWTATPGDWRGVPGWMMPPLRRALADNPADRWPDAGAFAKSLARPARVPRIAIAAAVILVAAVLAAIAWRTWTRPDPDDRDRIAASCRVSDSGVVAARAPALALAVAPRDSAVPLTVAGVFRTRLESRLRDAGIAFTGDSGAPSRAGVSLLALLEREGGDLSVTVSGKGDRGETLPLHLVRSGTSGRTEVLADSVASELLLELWRLHGAEAPRAAVPKRLSARAAWFEGEQRFAEAAWRDAGSSYERALRADPDCPMCEWRLLLIDRWRQAKVDPARLEALAAQSDRFSEPLLSLIPASAAPFPLRFDALEAVRNRYPDYYLAHFLYGDELMHRGPLDGRPRSGAADALALATMHRRDFAPAWEHRAWLAISDGDLAAACEALRHLPPASGERDPLARGVSILLQAAYTWRFVSPDAGRALHGGFLSGPEAPQLEMLAAGPRYLVGFGTPDAALDLADRFLELPAPELHASAAHARAFAFVMRGEPERALDALGALPEPDEAARWRALLSAGLALVDPGDTAVARLAAGERSALQAVIADPRTPPALREEAAWLGALGDIATPRPVGGPYLEFIEASGLAAGGDYAGALDRTAALRSLDAGQHATGPFFRALLHLRRGDWQLARGDTAAARREWRWHENQDVEGDLTGAPVAAEMDWALGPLARWRRALVGRAAAGSAPEVRKEVCADYAEVARLWAAGAARARARADSAREAFDDLRCGRS